MGISDATQRYYDIKSNREAGDGRYDIALIPRRKEDRGYIIEVKALTGLQKNITETELSEELEKAANKALDQIDDNHYADASGKVYKIGVAFYKKKCRVIGRQ